MSWPKVSVVIPVYNRAELIEETIQSVLAQSYDNIEILVIDDGSTDETATIVSAFPVPVRLYCQPHGGMGGSYSRNRGIAEANGELIAFLDSDDLWHPTKLEKQVQFIRNFPELSWVYCDSKAIDGETRQLMFRHSQVHGASSGDVLINLFIGNFIHTSSVVVRRNVFVNVGDFWQSPKATDRDMWLRIASSYPIGFLSEVLVSYRIHQKSVTERLSGEESYNADLAVIIRAIERDPAKLDQFKDHAVAQLNIRTGMLLAKQGNLKLARAYFKRGIMLNPSFLPGYPYFLATFLNEKMLKNFNSIRRRVRKSSSTRNRKIQ